MNGPMRAARRSKPAVEISLEDFVIWAYRDQQVDKMTARLLDPAERDAEDGCASDAWPAGSGALMARTGLLGTRVDGGGRSWTCHPDAELLHDLVCGLPVLSGLLIARFGRSGAAPEWRTSAPAPFAVPVPDATRSRIRHRIDLHWYRVSGARPRIGRGESAELVEVAPGEWDLGCRACAILYYPPPAYVEAVRAEYGAWHGAMAALLSKLDGTAGDGLRDHRVIGLKAAAAPWEAVSGYLGKE